MPVHGAGRSLAPTPFGADDGAADPALTAALALVGAAPGGAAGSRAAAVADLVAVLASCRVLVPVVAVAGETETTDAGLTVDKTSDMAVVTLTARDGRRTLPVFSGVEQLAAWDPAARPVPVDARTAALAAVDEGCELLVVDLATAAVVVPRPALWALAQGRPWTPSPDHPRVADALQAAVRGEPAVAGVRGEPGRRAELAVVLTVRPGLDRAALDALTARVSGALAADDAVAELVDSVELRIVPA